VGSHVPISSQTQALSPVTLARRSARGRLLRRLVALGALALFVAGMLVAAGLGSLVTTALPVVAAAAVAAGAAWALWRSRPWRIVPPVARAVTRTAATLARLAASLVGATGSTAVAMATAAPDVLRAAATRVRQFLEHPRERWQPPRALQELRGSLTVIVVRTIPARQQAHRGWRAMAARGTASALALAAAARRRLVRLGAVCLARVRVALRRDVEEALPGPSRGGAAARRAVARIRRPR
jgi:hypothetical protein